MTPWSLGPYFRFTLPAVSVPVPPLVLRHQPYKKYCPACDVSSVVTGAVVVMEEVRGKQNLPRLY